MCIVGMIHRRVDVRYLNATAVRTIVIDLTGQENEVLTKDRVTSFTIRVRM